MSELEEKINNLAELIANSEDIVALTGAGMSTESGIPDFRSPGTGLWEKVDPNEFASISSYVANPQRNLKFMLEMGMQIFKAKPHEGHKALTKLQKLGKLKGVLTQNIDGLHQRAGTENVIELHGTANEARCIECHETYEISFMINQVVKGDYEPTCGECSGLLKPNAIFFGEPLESSVIREADEMVEKCDLLIVLGSSLLVYPVAFYPQKVLSNDAEIGIINIQPTEMDRYAEVVIHKKIGKMLPKVADLVAKRLEV
ncbi:MAG: NAD-dependent protein deacylase 2 [Promethearchaeota archaeon]|nr:MAG: NAD-dependent protein deacylase 2 [Candidatus Lokiarchaeota archaeon]